MQLTIGIIVYYNIIHSNTLKGVCKAMVTKSLKLDEKIVEELELVAKGLNEESGADIYDFSNIVRIAINQYLNSENIKDVIELIRKKNLSNKKDLLLASESSLSKDWLSNEEDEAWANL